MSWIDRLENTKLTIITGDGNEYTPMWKNASRTISYNTKGFDFNGIDGTYVERKRKQGDQFPLTLWFQGENCIDLANNFEISARDSRAWTLKHPFMDEEITVQPLSLELNQEMYNVVQVNCTVWETLTIKYPEQTISTKRQIQSLKAIADNEVVITTVAALPVPDSATIVSSGAAVEEIGEKYGAIAKLLDDITKLKNLIRGATSAASNIIGSVDSYVRQAIALVNFPFQAIQTLKTKLTNLLENLETLKDTLLGDNSTSDNIILFQALSTALLTESCRVATSPTSTDYETRESVVDTIRQINTAYSGYLTTLDDEKIEQDSDLAIKLDVIINTTLANLSDIAQNSKQERIFTLDKDDNIINLAHQFFGPGDEALERFINTNQISLFEHIKIEKDRQIIYYV